MAGMDAFQQVRAGAILLLLDVPTGTIISIDQMVSFSWLTCKRV